MIERKEYLNALQDWRDRHVIKVITGIRRCGKSTLLRQYRERLLASGVKAENVISVNLEDLTFEELLDYKKLYAYVTERLSGSAMTYVFLDEVQMVPDFQKAVDSLFLREDVDIYITGSNAYLLSGELATLLSGRYIEINMLPLSFREYCSVHPGEDTDRLFADFLRDGSLPYIVTLDGTEEMKDMYLEGIYNTIIVKDIEERQKQRESDPNKRKVNDPVLLKNIARFLAGAVGSPVSDKSIAGYITSGGRKVSQATVSDYVDALVEPYIFYPAERYNVVGKQTMKTNGKLYIADLGLRRHILPRSRYDLGFSLENVVYLELRRRGWSVFVGKAGNTEIDFVARKNDRIHYYQVTASMTEEATFEREMAPLRAVRDNYPKTVLTLDRFTPGNYEGIEVMNAVDWLRGE